MKIREAIVLAGGLGTRLQAAIPGLPKCLAPVHDNPFLYYVLEHLKQQGIQHFVFALGYKATLIIEFLAQYAKDFTYQYHVEETALGTGGAIWQALKLTTTKTPLIVNGDTLYMASPGNADINPHTDCLLFLKPMTDCSRYGSVVIDKQNRVIGFNEKQSGSAGFINGGMYILNKEKFLSIQWPPSFSFEKDFLQAMHQTLCMEGIVDDGYFIDIGVPEDYERAVREMTGDSFHNPRS